MTRFSAVASTALDDDRLTGPDILVLAALGYHTDKSGWCFPSQDTLAKRARLTRQTVSESIKRLVKFGYVERFIPENRDLSKIKYRTVLDASSAPEAETTQPAVLVGYADKGGVALTDKPLTPEPTRVVAVADKACRPNRHKQEPLNQTTEPTKSADNLESVFLEVWSPWERNWSQARISRRGDGKAKTFDLFRRKASKNDPAIIRTAALAFLEKANPQYLPGLSVWLNRESWDTGNVVALEPRAEGPDWPTILSDWLESGAWKPALGPTPDQPGYRGPLETIRPLLEGRNRNHPVIARIWAKLEPQLFAATGELT